MSLSFGLQPAAPRPSPAKLVPKKPKNAIARTIMRVGLSDSESDLSEEELLDVGAAARGGGGGGDDSDGFD